MAFGSQHLAKVAADAFQTSMEKEVQNAVDQTGFGKFHYKLFIVSAMVFMNVAFGISTVSLIVPAAACDFEMTTADKGRLTAAPMLGMVLGSYFWGCLAAIKGRRVALLASLFLDGFIGILSSLVPNFWVFTCLRFINGFAITGQGAVIFPYLGEFQPSKFREKILCWMEMAWTIGIIILPLFGWLIIPMTFHYRLGYFSFASWNLFAFLCAVPAISIGTALLFFPESPKYLIEHSQNIKAVKILSQMYAENTRNPPENYPIKFIRCQKDIINGKEAAPIKESLVLSEKRKNKEKEMWTILINVFKYTVMILKPPYLTSTLLICALQFSITLSYYTLMIWLPELFQRFAEFETRHPNASASLCEVSYAKLISNESISDEFRCDTKIRTSVYVHTIILGMACIPTSIWLPTCINRLGYRFFLVFSTVLAGAAATGLFFVTSSTQNLILACIFEALTSMSVSIVYCVLVDFYPTHLRVISASFSALCGRSGALIGNLIFGYLLDFHCVVPIALVASLLFFAAVLSVFLTDEVKVKSTNDISTVNHSISTYTA